MARYERILTALLVIAAIVIAAVNVYRFVISPGNPSGTRAQSASVFDDWQDLLREGIALDSNTTAPVTIAYFGDLECPGCARFHHAIESVKSEFNNQVSSVFVHYPLPNHRFAIPGAIAAECAAAENRIPAFIASVYAKQDSLGLRPWQAFAMDAGVQDSAQFAECVTNTKTVLRISRGMEFGARVGVRGTPTVIVNGWRFDFPPDPKTLADAVRRLIAGHTPL